MKVGEGVGETAVETAEERELVGGSGALNEVCGEIAVCHGRHNEGDGLRVCVATNLCIILVPGTVG